MNYSSFLLRVCFVSSLLGRALPQGNSLLPRASASHPSQNKSKNSLHSSGGASPYISKRLIGRLVHRIVSTLNSRLSVMPKSNSKKEVFQPHLPVRLPCYDLAPITSFALGRSSRSRTSGAPGFHGLTGGVYKARERIHRAMADARLLANPASWSRVADSNPN